MPNPDVISSVQNSLIKELSGLKQKKLRDEYGQILIEGQHPIQEAIDAGVSLDFVFVLGETNPLQSPIPVTRVTDNVMAKLASTDTPPPIIAVGQKPAYAPDYQSLQTHTLILGLDGLQDPGNAGTLIRSACAFGAHALWTIGHGVDVFSPKVIRASSGMVFRLPVLTLPSAREISPLQADVGLRVLSADAHRGEPYRKADLATGPLLLLMGSEAHGISPELAAMAQPLHIPMAPGIESLNVGVAGSILLAEAYGQRQNAS